LLNVIVLHEPTSYLFYMPKLRHYDKLNTARFVTFSCYRRHKLLLHSSTIEVFLEELARIRSEKRVRIFGYVVMPEHVHLVLHVPDTLKLGSVIAQLKSRSASRIISNRILQLSDDCRMKRDGRERWAFWQPRCYDHNCRSNETLLEKIKYCHNNPVKRGLVTEPGMWRWSSYNWYIGDRDVPLEMDRLDIDTDLSVRTKLEKPT